ncbi:GmrSD restriction endonuclease domain-containing protein [Streptomyces sp. NPDC001450]
MAGTAAERRDLPEPPPADVVRKELDELNVSAPRSMAGYSRAKFPHWITQYGACDTREAVVKRDGQNVVQDDQCRAVSGTWVSPYDGKVATKPSTEVDIDHMVPLANAWRSGADEWDTALRRKFANDLNNPKDQLLLNRVKLQCRDREVQRHRCPFSNLYARPPPPLRFTGVQRHPRLNEPCNKPAEDQCDPDIGEDRPKGSDARSGDI